MFTMLKKVAVTLALAVALITPLLVVPTQVAYASESQLAACRGIGLSGTNCGGGNENRVYGVIRAVINVLSVLIGAVAVIMIIVGGFKFITANGDSNNVASARSTIIYAAIGLIIVALAQAIVRFTIGFTQ